MLAKFESTQAVVGVVGLGYVGLPFAVEKAKVGFQVIGFDRQDARCDQVNRGESYILDVNSADLKELTDSGRILATSEMSELANVDAIIVAVPTPLTKNLTPDLQYVEGVTREIAQILRPGQFVCLESTTYPGTTAEVMRPILESSGLVADQDFFLAHSPERVDPGNQRYTTKNTSKVVGGIGPNSLRVAQAFYERTIQQVVPVSSAEAAEMVKVFENTFRAVNIALVNELAQLCDRMNLNVWEVLEAAHTKPFGIMPFYPGPGVGGHCIPLDPHYLEWKAREYNFTTRFIALAGEINRSMPEFVLEKASRALNSRQKSLAGSKVLLCGVAYKADVSDWRESPALEIFDMLKSAGADVQFSDPYVPEIVVNGESYQSVELNETYLSESDLVIITTAHRTVDYGLVAESANLIFDTRNALRGIECIEEKVILL
ncbi:nucleotide sugar dehydrogenase [Kamptonema cortianum]|nr:nucleotide sugar dehydrogenase [Kamptonema cortianum]